MGLFEAFGTCIKKYAVFQGRARRSEYWLFALFNGIVGMLISGASSLCSFLGSQYGGLVVFGIYFVYILFVFLPSLAVSVRRLHDTGHSGAHYLLILIPVIGSIILLVYFCRDSDPGDNQYGPNPKGQGSGYGEPQRYRTPDVDPQATSYSYAESYPLTVSPYSDTGILRVTCVSGPYSGRSATGDTLYVGRDANQCQVVFPDTPGVSRMHCVLQAEGRRIAVRDLRSSYGTFLADGTRLEPERTYYVENGATLYLGSKKAGVSVSLL